MSLKVYLVGFMGSGKTTAGRKLASILGVAFIDLDEKIKTAEGCSISEIFNTKGEESFRQIESQHLKNDLPTSFVMATGGGTPCFHNNMAWMKRNGPTVYLKASASFLASRLKSDRHRPLLAGLKGEALLSHIQTMLDSREQFYNESEIIVSAMDLDIKSIASRITPDMHL